ncbi:hypothetical protein NQ314_006900 [Rhamnusium bicolor]|uniref:Uncharacterized protein n=1 Tax=Rhamnusium bicolor TaxID=1586634 RepID=A0AAV8YVW8_9CUCU|nr:hypothetical protein NQ314_006900 [Rhamnusium bicolor]
MFNYNRAFIFTFPDHPKNSTIDYKSNSSCSSPSKDMKNSDRCGMPYGAQVPVLPVRNNLRRPNSSHFPQASRFHFRKGLTSKCTWKCTAIVFIILSMVLTAALSYISASSLLNWSYQNTKPCEVLVGDNTQIVPASKTVPSETNLSTSSRPKTSNSGGKYNEPVYSRKRREVDDTQHVFVLSNATTNSSGPPSTSGHDRPDSLHASTVKPLHDLNHLTTRKLSVLDVIAPSTNIPNTQSRHTDNLFNTTEEIISATASLSLESTTQSHAFSINSTPSNLSSVTDSLEESATSTEIFEKTIENNETSEPIPKDILPGENREEMYDDISTEEDNISDSSLFKLDSETYDELNREQSSKLVHFKSSEIQHDSPHIFLWSR